MAEVSFGAWLKRQRLSVGLTQQQLARQIGCAEITLRKIEAEERRPSGEIVARLAEIFTIPPADQTSFGRFARGDWTQSPGECPSSPPWSPTRALRSNLPAAITTLIGREQEIGRLRGYLREAKIRLVTLVGSPGIGKTSLGLEVARAALADYPAGVFFAALAPLEDATLVPGALAQALGYVEAEALPTLKQLEEGIRDKPMLIVLDNCEHLIEGLAPIVSELLSTCSHLKLLATSRESLRIAGEWVFAVPALATPTSGTTVDLETALQFPALALFVERARAVRSEFALTPENLLPVAAICVQLEGLPLAIELIAARTRLLSPRPLLERLTEAFVLSADGMRASARQKTLGNAIAWSYDLLTREEQKQFAGLAVFPDSFTLEAAEAIAWPVGAAKSSAELVTALLDKSLLQRSSDVRGEQRFAMLVTIREFALTRLRRSGDEAGTRDRHLAYYLALAEQGDGELRGPRQVEWIERLENEQVNFRAAVEWGLAQNKVEAVLRLLAALGWLWHVRGHYSEALCWLDRIRALPQAAEYPLPYGRLLNHLGRFCWNEGEPRMAHALLEESQALSLMLGAEGERNLADALNWHGLLFYYIEGQSLQAKAHLDRALELYRNWEDERGLVPTTFHLGIVEMGLNHEDRALSLMEQSLIRFRQFGDLFFVGRVCSNLGDLFFGQGQYDQAQGFYEQQLEIDQQLQFWEGIAEGWHDLGRLRHPAGDDARAGQCCEESVRVCREHALSKQEPFAYAGLMALHLDNFALALQHFAHLLHLAQRAESLPDVGRALNGLATVAGGTHQPESAAKLLGAAQALLDAGGNSNPWAPLQEFDRYIQIAGDELGQDRFNALCAEGSAMTMEQAIQFALHETSPEPD